MTSTNGQVVSVNISEYCDPSRYGFPIFTPGVDEGHHHITVVGDIDVP